MWIAIAAVSGTGAVVAGAVGAHGLRGSVTPEQITAWATASHYQLIHSLALLALGLFSAATGRSILWPATLFLAGIVLFSGSIYLLVLTPLRWLGPLTPLGGLCLIAAWLSLLGLARS